MKGKLRARMGTSKLYSLRAWKKMQDKSVTEWLPESQQNCARLLRARNQEAGVVPVQPRRAPAT